MENSYVLSIGLHGGNEMYDFSDLDSYTDIMSDFEDK